MPGTWHRLVSNTEQGAPNSDLTSLSAPLCLLRFLLVIICFSMSDSQTHTHRLCVMSFVPGFIYMYKFICLSCAWHCPGNDDDAPDAVVPEFVRIYVIRQKRKPGYWGVACFLEVDFSERWGSAVWCPAVLTETSTINLIANSCKPSSVAPSTLFLGVAAATTLFTLCRASSQMCDLFNLYN